MNLYWSHFSKFLIFGFLHRYSINLKIVERIFAKSLKEREIFLRESFKAIVNKYLRV